MVGQIPPRRDLPYHPIKNQNPKIKTMNKKLIQILGLDAKATDEQIVAAVQAIQNRLDSFEKTEVQRAADEKIIVEKMTRGLSREQAVHVIQRQREFEAAKDKSKVQGPKSKVADK